MALLKSGKTMLMVDAILFIYSDDVPNQTYSVTGVQLLAD